VTGGARRVGRAIALELARSGCQVTITYSRSEAEAQATAAELGAGARALKLELDDLGAVEEFAQRLSREPLDVLVHSAAIYSPTPLDAVSPQDSLRFFRVNALAPLLLSKQFAARLAESKLEGGGAIVAMADIHATGLPRKEFSAYAMSKAALVEMVRTLAVELAPRVRVNAVAPGVVAWPESGYESDEAAQREYLKRVPLARAGTARDAAEAVRWLALEARYVTGQVIRVDGGRSLR
jgi:pteridine reductase